MGNRPRAASIGLVAIVAILSGYYFFFHLRNVSTRTFEVNPGGISSTTLQVSESQYATRDFVIKDGAHVSTYFNSRYPIKLDLYGYERLQVLYSEDGYTYATYAKPAGGTIWPIIRESSTTKESTGLYSGGDFSPNNHRYIWASFQDYASGGFCFVQINPVSMTCIVPSNSTETFLTDAGPAEGQFVDGEWIDDTHYKFNVYKKFSNAYLDSQPIRTAVFTFI